MEEQIYLSFNTCIEMLLDRNLTIRSGIRNYAYSQFNELYNHFNNYSGVFDIEGYDEKNNNRTIIRFIKDINEKKKGTLMGIQNQKDSISVEVELRELTNFLRDTNQLSNNDRIIFVICYGEKLHKVHEKLEEDLLNTQFFHVNRLIFNITKHEYVPKHELLYKNEIEIIKKKLNINHIKQLPIIQINDPIARYFGMKYGDVCRIYRPSPTTKIHICYRACVHLENE